MSEPAKLAEWLENQKKELDRAKIRGFGVQRGVLDLISILTDGADVTDDNLVGTVQLTGTFLIDTARIDFSDIG